MLLRKLQPFISRSLMIQKNNQSFISFSTNKSRKAMGFQEGNAKLSYEIIEMICQTPTESQLQQSSLTQRILSHIKNKKQVSEESRKEISSLFQSGIDIRNQKHIFSQSRIQKGQIKIQQSKRKLFVFHPTYMVTSQIFLKIRELQENQQILTGHMGISKTVSVFLFWKLTHYMDEYRFSQAKKVPQEYFKIPKIFYWTIYGNGNQQLIVQNILEQQAQPKFQYSKKNKLADLRGYYRKFNKNLNVVLIVDQINVVARNLRIRENLKQQKNLSDQNKQKLENSKTFLKMIKKTFESVLPNFVEILYLSSMGIQDEIALQFELSRDQKHQKIDKNFVSYSSEIFKDVNLYGLVDYFIFEFGQRVFKQNKEKTLEQSLKRQLRNQCYSYLDSNKGDYFFTPRGLRQKIEKTKSTFLSYFKTLKNNEEKIKFIYNEFKNLVKKQTQEYGSILNQGFLKNDKNDQYRLEIHFALYNHLFMLSRQKDQKRDEKLNKNENQIDTKDFKFSQDQLNKYLDKRLFFLSDLDPYLKINLQLPLKLILKILQKTMTDNIKEYLKNHSKIFKKVVKKDKIGQFVQQFFIQALKNGTDFQIITWSNQLFKFPGINQKQCWFESIPQFRKDQNNKKLEDIVIRRQKNYQFLSSFIPFIKKMSQQKRSSASALFLPTKLKPSQIQKNQTLPSYQKFDKNSKCIDAILLRYDQTYTPLVDIWAFDLTVGTNTSDKLMNFIKQFIGFKDRMVNKIFIQRQNQSPKQIEVKLYYYVLNNTDFQEDILVLLNKSFNNQIKFQNGSNNSQYKVRSLKDQTSFLLKQIGCLNYEKNIKFINPTEGNALAFQEAVNQSIIIDRLNKQDKL